MASRGFSGRPKTFGFRSRNAAVLSPTLWLHLGSNALISLSTTFLEKRQELAINSCPNSQEFSGLNLCPDHLTGHLSPPL